MTGDERGQVAVVREIHARFHAMKTYGKEPESLAAITTMMLSDLADFPTEKVLLAFKTHAQRSEEFPTTANLVSLIKRNGRPPLRESDIIAIRKKEDRTKEDWDTLREWDNQQREGWGGEDDHAKSEAMLAENIRLRKEVMELRDEVRRLSDLLKAREEVKALQPAVAPPPRPVPTLKERIEAVVSSMRLFGSSEEEVGQFISSAEAGEGAV